MSQPQPPESRPPPSPEGRIETAVGVVKNLTFTNILIIALLLFMGLPTYVIWRALDDDKLMDRLLSTYEEIGIPGTGCTLRHIQERGGPELYGVSSGFAFQGADRWFVSVVLDHQPSSEETVSYCESLKLIGDKMLDRGDDRSGRVGSDSPAVQ